ncbi:MAG: AAA family ATPase [Turneriella sp.]|nr:AAA family ATPase [Turneriella sp.]
MHQQLVSSLQQIHTCILLGMHPLIGNAVRKNTEWLLKELLTSCLNVPLAEIDDKTLDHLLQRAQPLLSDHAQFHEFLQALRTLTNIASHDRRLSTNLPRGPELLNMFLAAYFYIAGNFLGIDEQQITKEMESSFSALVPLPEKNTKESQLVIEEIVNEESYQKCFRQDYRLGLHQQALLDSARLPAWSHPIVSLALFSRKLLFEIPYLQLVRRMYSGLKLLNLRLLGKFSVILADIGGLEMVLYIGTSMETEVWLKTVCVFTNNKSFIDLIKIDLQNRGALADVAGVINDAEAQHRFLAQLRQIYQGVKNQVFAAETEIALQRNRQLSPVAEPFAQSNLTLVTSDFELSQALRYPIDSWRLFLHPLQRDVVNAPSRFLFIEGSPGTGKTVVLLHRIRKQVLRNREYDRIGQRRGLLRLLVLTFSEALKKNIAEMLKKLDPSITDAELLLYSLPEFVNLLNSGELELSAELGRNIYVGAKFRNSRQSYITDLFIDELQDFPLRERSRLTEAIALFTRLTRTSITATYDINQAIYHANSAVQEFISSIPGADTRVLTYCYRMSRELYETSLLFRQRCEELFNDACEVTTANRSLQRIKRNDCSYALSGGRVELAPISLRMVPEQVEKFLGQLRTSYSNADIGVVYFQEEQRKGSALPDEIIQMKNLNALHGVRVMNHLAVKGLEFKAGIIVNAHLPFQQFSRSLSYARKLRVAYLLLAKLWESESKLGPLPDGVDNDENPEPRLRFAQEALPLFLAFSRYVTDHDYRELLGEDKTLYPQNDMEGGISLIRSWATRTSVAAVINSLEFVKNRDPVQASAMVLRKCMKMREAIKNELQQKIAKIQEDRQKLYDNIDLTMANIQFNQFYVATTRFRDLAYVLYDERVPLREFLSSQTG